MNNEVMIVWTTDNKDTSLHMVCLYALNAKLQGWFDDVTLLIWGASQKLVVEDLDVSSKVKEIIDAGVHVVACKKCSEDMDIEAPLQRCGIDVFYTGVLLSDWAKSRKPLLTF